MIKLLFNATLAVLSLPIIVALLCRCAALHPGEHRRSALLMHACMLAAASGVLVHGIYGLCDVVDVMVLGSCAAWLALSLETWRHGVPGYLRR